MKKRIQINGAIIFLSVLSTIIFPKFFLRTTVDNADTVAAVLGIILILIGFTLRISARGFKSEQSQSGHFLVKDGPYALVRNPMYLGILGIASGVILFLFRWWVLIIFIFFFIFRYVRLILNEEEKLSSHFAKEYQEYLKKTPRLFPAFKQLISGKLGQYLPLKPKWIKKEINSIIAMVFGIIIIKLVIHKLI